MPQVCPICKQPGHVMAQCPFFIAAQMNMAQQYSMMPMNMQIPVPPQMQMLNAYGGFPGASMPMMAPGNTLPMVNGVSGGVGTPQMPPGPAQAGAPGMPQISLKPPQHAPGKKPVAIPVLPTTEKQRASVQAGKQSNSRGSKPPSKSSSSSSSSSSSDHKKKDGESRDHHSQRSSSRHHRHHHSHHDSHHTKRSHSRDRGKESDDKSKDKDKEKSKEKDKKEKESGMKRSHHDKSSSSSSRDKKRSRH